MKQHKEIIDLETGGFSITKNGVCEIAMLIIDDAMNVVKELNLLIKPYPIEEGSSELVSYKADAMAVNKISMDEILNGEDVKDVMFKVSNAIINYNVSTFIGHNIKSFDIPRLDYLLQRFQNISIAGFPLEDTLEMSRDKLSLKSNTLESVCEYFGVVNPDSHRALGDCYATLEIYKKLKL